MAPVSTTKVCSTAPCRWRLVLWGIAVFVVLLAGTRLIQAYSGACDSELGGHPDEAGHFVTGLMVRDFILAGPLQNPLRYAQRYYEHYPKVALGHWPPVFYLLQAGWTIWQAPTPSAVLVLMAVLVALLGTTLFAVTARLWGVPAGVVTAAACLCLPLVQEYGGMVMTEVPIAWFSLLAAVSFARYAEHRDRRWAVAFSLLAAVAILTKGTALYLALLPPLVILLRRDYGLLRDPWLWVAAGIVVLVCAPWTLLTLGMVRNGWVEGGPSWHFTREAVPYYASRMFLALGPVISVMALVGVGFVLCRGRKTADAKGITGTAMLALVLSILLFHFVVPCGYEARHLLPAVPAALVLAMVCGVAVWEVAARRHGVAVAALVAVGLSCAFLLCTWRLPQKRYAGFRPVVEYLFSQPALLAGTVFVSSEARGEGMMISEMAVCDRALRFRVCRASKLLASSTWDGGGYALSVKDADELIASLSREGVRVLVVDRTVPAEKRVEHHDFLDRVLRERSDRFHELRTFPVCRAGVAVGDGVVLVQLDPPARVP